MSVAIGLRGTGSLGYSIVPALSGRRRPGRRITAPGVGQLPDWSIAWGQGHPLPGGLALAHVPANRAVVPCDGVTRRHEDATPLASDDAESAQYPTADAHDLSAQSADLVGGRALPPHAAAELPGRRFARPPARHLPILDSGRSCLGRSPSRLCRRR